jgi:hypothetical protein
MSQGTSRRRLLAAAIAAALVLNVLGLGAILATPTAAQAGNTPTSTGTPTPDLGEQAPYYEDETAEVDNRSWTYGHRAPTLANVTHYLTRVGTFIVGNEPAQGGGYAGPLILMLVFGGGILGSIAGTGVGPIGGAVLLVTGSAGLVGINLAPVWLYPVVIIIVGGIATMITLRAIR